MMTRFQEQYPVRPVAPDDVPSQFGSRVLSHADGNCDAVRRRAKISDLSPGISDLQIDALAHLTIKKRGLRASIFATKEQHRRTASGDLDVAAVWIRVGAAILRIKKNEVLDGPHGGEND